MTRITAYGVGEQHIPAERVTLSSQVAVSHRDRAESIAAGTALHNRVVARAQALRASGDATWHSATPTSTHVRVWTDKDGVTHRDHYTASRVEVKLSNLGLVSDLVAELSAMGVTVSTSWALTEKTRSAALEGVRARAVTDAVGKSRQFARALDAEVGEIVTVAEQQHVSAVAMRSAAVGSGGAAAEVTRPEITVRAEVSVEVATA